jgi:hypothetical protein
MRPSAISIWANCLSRRLDEFAVIALVLVSIFDRKFADRIIKGAARSYAQQTDSTDGTSSSRHTPIMLMIMAPSKPD